MDHTKYVKVCFTKGLLYFIKYMRQLLIFTGKLMLAISVKSLVNIQFEVLLLVVQNQPYGCISKLSMIILVKKQ